MYSIAIPSHNRSKLIKEKVLAFLEKHYIDPCNIYIFVDNDEVEIYDQALLGCGYNIVIGKKGIAEQRMAISNFFDEDDMIVSLDDDVEEIYHYKQPIEDFNQLVLDTFEKLYQNNLTLAGVYPTNNPFYFKDDDTKDLRFCIGQLKMFINKRHVEEREYVLLEDYENTIKHYQFRGGVLRLNNIGLKANYNSLKGGLKEYRTDEKKQIEIIKFTKKYPKYCSIKKSGKDIILNRKVVNDVVSTLWIGRELNELSKLCLMSWIKQGYDINLYIDTSKPFDLGELPESRVKLLDAYEIYKNDELDILPYSDLWRYKLLYHHGGTWLDADMFLLRRLPQIPSTIISSEHTFQSGAYKSKEALVPNIGVMRFKQGDLLLGKIILFIEKRLAKGMKPIFCDNMKVFRKIIKESDGYPVSAVLDYCPLDFWNCKESYYDVSYQKKYDVEPYTNTEILKHSIGIHMWNHITTNKHKIHFDKVHPHSLFSMLRNRIQ